VRVLELFLPHLVVVLIQAVFFEILQIVSVLLSHLKE
jgi:hypothetical protein